MLVENPIVSDDTLIAHGYNISYNSRVSAEDIVHEIFSSGIYRFNTNRLFPFIIDAGSNIGIATLYFKSLYPKARVLCFEPDPNAFQKLRLNIERNGLEQVTTVNAALCAHQGEVEFYGQLTPQIADARGNSIFPQWGEQRQANQAMTVQAVQLSRYLPEYVDFLKLDVEGAELQVLRELGNKITSIHEMVIEVHEIAEISGENNLQDLLTLLHSFDYETKIIYQLDNKVLPNEVQGWVSRFNPHLCLVHAKQAS